MQMSSSFHWGGNWADLVPTSIGNDDDRHRLSTTTTTSNSNNSSSPSTSTGTTSTTQHQYQPIASLPGGSIPSWILYRPARGYSNSKLAQIFHARTLHRKHYPEINHFRIVSVCPSWVNTQIDGSSSSSNSSSTTKSTTMDNSSFLQNVRSSIYQLLKQSFMYEHDGFGIKSSLHAIFNNRNTNNNNHPTTTNMTTSTTNNNNQHHHHHYDGSLSAGEDYFINTHIMKVASIITFPQSFGQWTFRYSLRDTGLFLFSWIVFAVQKFNPTSSCMKQQHATTTTTTRTPAAAAAAIPNPITQNETIQDLLYDWSQQAVMEWL